MHKFYYTYKITLLKGSLAGHYYYGQHRTNNINDGYAGSGRKIKDYYKKYGKIEHQTYIKEIISFYNDEDELNQAEKDLIGDKYKNDELCLNLCEGGGSSSGYKLTEEQKKKLSDSHKGLHHSEETKRKISENNYTKLNGHSIETRKKLSDARKGIVFSEEHKQKLRNRIISEESRKKMSESAKRRGISEKTREKISASLKGHTGFNKGKHRKYLDDGSFIMVI